MSLKSCLKKNVSSLVSWRNYLHNSILHAKYRNKSMDEVFTDIYLRNHWNGKQSRSGTGSELNQTHQVKLILKQVIKEYKVSTLLDIPCGDLNWIKDVDMEDVTYHGADIVETIINNNIEKNKNEGRRFLVANITSSKLPVADLVLCRDCLVHFSYEDIKKAIQNLKVSQCKYLLTTTFPLHSNVSIVTGNWRPVNLNASPIKFPTPLAMFNEKCSEDDRYTDKSLGLWKISDLP
jgi:hypothetical protein